MAISCVKQFYFTHKSYEETEESFESDRTLGRYVDRNKPKGNTITCRSTGYLTYVIPAANQHTHHFLCCKINAQMFASCKTTVSCNTKLFRKQNIMAFN